jgi:hypothetical protein
MDAGGSAVLRRLVFTLALAGCYTPHPQDGSWKCDADNNYLCPDGLTCDRSSLLCVHTITPSDGGIDLSLPDLASGPTVRSCDDKVAAGAFSNLTNLGAVNGSGDEHALAITPDGARVYFLDGTGALETATLSGKSAGAPSAVAIGGGPTTLNGGSFTSDGTYWFSGTMAGATQLWSATKTTPTTLTAMTPLRPTATDCAFTDPVFSAGSSANELFIGYPLGGCANGAMIAIGAKDKDKGAFIGAVGVRNLRSPSLLPAPDAFARTLLMSTTGTGARLLYSQRSVSMGGTGTIPGSFSSPHAIPMDGIGAPGGTQGDVQAVVSPDCSTIYLVSDRSGGHGGLDLWAADIAAQ